MKFKFILLISFLWVSKVNAVEIPKVVFVPTEFNTCDNCTFIYTDHHKLLQAAAIRQTNKHCEKDQGIYVCKEDKKE